MDQNLDNVLDLGGAVESQELNLLGPGVHTVKITEVKVAPLKEGKNPVLTVRFEDANGAVGSEFFNIVGKNPDTTAKLKGRILTLAKAAGFLDHQLKGNFNIQSIVGMTIKIVLNLNQYINSKGNVANGTFCKFAGFAGTVNDTKIAYNTKDDKFVDAPTTSSALDSIDNSYSDVLNDGYAEVPDTELVTKF